MSKSSSNTTILTVTKCGNAVELTQSDIVQLIDNAKASGRAIAEMELQKYGDRSACGFAWIIIDENIRVNSKLGKALIAAGLEKNYRGLFELWNPSGLGVQSVDILEAGARETAAYIRRELGLKCYADSRLD